MSDSQGTFAWYDLTTSDVNATFHQEVIGWGTQAWGGGEKPYVTWTAGESPVAAAG